MNARPFIAAAFLSVAVACPCEAQPWVLTGDDLWTVEDEYHGTHASTCPAEPGTVICGSDTMHEWIIMAVLPLGAGGQAQRG